MNLRGNNTGADNMKQRKWRTLAYLGVALAIAMAFGVAAAVVVGLDGAAVFPVDI